MNGFAILTRVILIGAAAKAVRALKEVHDERLRRPAR
jgi:hypothetical protein